MPTDFKGAYLPTTQIWDAAEVSNSNINDASKDILVSMYQRLANMAMMINDKETALYPMSEFVCGKKYFPNPTLTSSSAQTPKMRQVFRKTINWDKPLPNAALDTVAHGITFDANTILTRIYAAATDPTHKLYIPIPLIDCKFGTIGIWATGTDIVIDCCGFDGTDFTITYVVIEYIKF